MTIKASVLGSEIEAIRTAMMAVTQPSDQIKEAIQTKERLERKIKSYFEQVEAAIKQYNTDRRQIVIDWALSNDLGYCTSGDHLSSLHTLEGVIKSGAYVSSGYYESLHSFEDRGYVCPECRHGLSSGSGRYEGEFTSFATYELKAPTKSLEMIPTYDFDLRKLAVANGIELPAEAELSTRSYPKFVSIGELKLVFPRQ